MAAPPSLNPTKRWNAHREELISREQRKFARLKWKQFLRAKPIGAIVDGQRRDSPQRIAWEREYNARTLLHPAQNPHNNLLRPAGFIQTIKNLLRPADRKS